MNPAQIYRRAAWLAGKLNFDISGLFWFEDQDYLEIEPLDEVTIDGITFNSHARGLQMLTPDGFSFVSFKDVPDIIDLNPHSFRLLLQIFVS